MQIKKAVILAAGYGTRFLPATKNVPKELLPVINTPTIHYIVENCVNAGIRDIIIVTRFGNSAIEDYFDSTPALEKYLIDKGKVEEAEKIKKIYTQANFIFVRQDPTLPYGNAAPLYTVKDLVNNEPFLYCWGDDLVIGANPMQEIVTEYEQNLSESVLLCTQVEDELIPKLGMVKFKDNSNQVEKIIEKPKLEDSPSKYASVSCFVFTPKILEYLDPEKVEKGKEFILQEAIDKMITDGSKVSGVITKGKWFTTGDPLNYLKATVEIALNREDLNKEFVEYLKKRLNQL